jgi:hypothetical protein
VPWSEACAVETEKFGLVEGALEGAPRSDVGEIDERARGLRDGDAGALGYFALLQRCPMHHKPRPLAAGRRGHVNRSFIAQETPQNCSTEVAQSGFISASQHGGHEVPVPRESGIANHVYAAMHTMEPPPLHLPIDGVIAPPKRPELSAANDPVLPPRKLRNRSIRGVLSRFSAHIAVKRDSTSIRPPGVPASGRE